MGVRTARRPGCRGSPHPDLLAVKAPASPAARTAGCTPSGSARSPSSIVGSRRRSPRPNNCMSSSDRTPRTPPALLVRQLVQRQLVVVPEEVRVLAVLGDRDRLLQPSLHDRRSVLPRQRQPHRLHHVEVEEQVDLVRVLATEEVDQILFRDQVDLAQQHPVAAPAGDEQRSCCRISWGPVDVADRLVSMRNGTASTRKPSTPSPARSRRSWPSRRAPSGCRCSGPAGASRTRAGSTAPPCRPRPRCCPRRRGTRRPSSSASGGRARRRNRGSGCPGDERASRNHGCLADVWLTTRSMITRIPRSLHVRISDTKSRASRVAGPRRRSP